MSTPIKSSNTTGSGANVSPALNDLMSKLTAQTQGQNAMGGASEAPDHAFSRWLEKHATEKEPTRRPEAQPASATGAKNNALQNNLAASRAAEQALARARQMAAPTAKPLEPHVADPNARADAAKPAKAKSEQNGAAKSARKEGQAKPAQADKAAQPDEAREDKDTNVATATADGVAVVRELTPPPTIQAGDSAGMMAWLASLTGGDANAQGLPNGELAQGDQAMGKDEVDAAALDLSSKSKSAGHGRQGMTMDLQAWQGVSGKADAMMEQLGKGGRLDSDPLAGLMAGGAAKTGGFNQILNEASQSIRHESTTLNTPFGSPEFPQALAEKVSMWVSAARDEGPMTAELHLNPAEMGPINVKISLDGQSAHVDFAATALETRQAIEASMPMLSSALSDVGLSLTGGDVSSQTSQQAFEQAARESGASGRASGRTGDGRSEEGEEAPGVRQVSAPRPGRAGGLDLYA